MSVLTRCLLDKVVARRAVEGLLKLAEGDSLSEQELFAVDLLYASVEGRIRLFIVPSSKSVLDLLLRLPRYTVVIQAFLDHTETAFPTRYFARWSRRLREFGYTPEDARVLALASFGSDQGGNFLGMHWVATYDQPLMSLWALKQAAIAKRLKAMTDQIPHPYSQVRLPKVSQPEFVVTESRN
jgi:hypothetical protein